MYILYTCDRDVLQQRPKPWGPSAQLQAWPKTKWRRSSPLSSRSAGDQPRLGSSGSQRDARMETLRLALGIEPGKTVDYRQTDTAGGPGVTVLSPRQVTGVAGEGLCPGTAWERCSLCISTWGGTSEQMPPALGSSRVEHRGEAEKHPPPAAPSPPLEGCTARLTVESGREGSAQIQRPLSWCSDHLPQYRLCREGPHLSRLLPLHLLSTCVWREQRNCLSSPCTCHENRVFWTHPSR